MATIAPTMLGLERRTTLVHLFAAAVTVAFSGFSARIWAETRTDSGSGCFEPDAAKERVAGVLGVAGNELIVEVTSAPRGVSTEVRLRVTTRAGKVGLERRYVLSPADCKHAVELITTVTERFLAEVPIEQWSEARPATQAKPTAKHERARPPAPLTDRPLTLDPTVWGGLAATPVPSFGVSAALGAKLRIGRNADRLSLGVHGRMHAPRELGSGEYQPWFLLGGAGFIHWFGAWGVDLELRGGPVHVRGSGYAENRESWLPWVEAASSVRYDFRPIAVGLELCASPLRHRVTTASGSDSELLSSLQVGLILEGSLSRKD